MENKPGRFEPSILLVEDDPLTREQLGDLLQERYYRLHVAENGKQGLEIYKQIRPDIVITDILMPVMDGLDMAREIRKLNPLAHIVIITAYGHREDVSDLRDLVTYIAKPVDIDELFKVIKACSIKMPGKTAR